jgi:beta-galactosidase
MNATPPQLGPAFLFGASVYPENLSRPQWLKMLRRFSAAGFTALRLGESAWGRLEPSRGHFRFEWLVQALDDIHGCGMAAVVGTSTYIAPQWLLADHPDALVQLEPGVPVHPMYRKAASIAHPAYRAACRAFIGAYARAIAGHPAVVGWQLDNEIDALSMLRPDYSPAGEAAWQQWLQRTFGSVEAMNQRLGLDQWGWAARAFDEVPQPRYLSTEGSARLPMLSLTSLKQRRDLIAGFLVEQAQVLRSAGAAGWITSNWMTNWTTLIDDPASRQVLDVAGLNVYPLGPDRERYWRSHTWFLDAARTVPGAGKFVVTETRAGVTGTSHMLDSFPTRAEFRFWMHQMAAFGAQGLLFWSGHRWPAGHWPHWGGLMNWAGDPEPEMAWVDELGAWFARWGETLNSAPVRARAAVITDFEQRAALQVFRHTPASTDLLPAVFDLFHRMGTGVDALAGPAACDVQALSAYRVIVVAGVSLISGGALAAALEHFASSGGFVVVTPFSGYQTADGVFHPEGAGAPLAKLTGCTLASVRRLGTAADPDSDTHFAVFQVDGRQFEVPLGLDGYCETLVCDRETTAFAFLNYGDPALANAPVAAERRVGEGRVIKLGVWPDDDTLLALLQGLLGPDAPLALPRGVRAVPRADKSMFVLNSLRTPVQVSLPYAGVQDRITGVVGPAPSQLAPHQAVWLAPVT